MFSQLMSFTATGWLFRVVLLRGIGRVTVNVVPHPPPSGSWGLGEEAGLCCQPSCPHGLSGIRLNEAGDKALGGVSHLGEGPWDSMGASV